MNLALMLHHGVRANAPNEVMGHPHMELLASDPHDRQRLKVLADQLAAFGGIPFSYKEISAADATHPGAVLRVALGERA